MTSPAAARYTRVTKLSYRRALSESGGGKTTPLLPSSVHSPKFGGTQLSNVVDLMRGLELFGVRANATAEAASKAPPITT